ncbi:MAG: hypothetical protein ACLP9C_09435 [Acidimicrobiales bacterium]
MAHLIQIDGQRRVAVDKTIVKRASATSEPVSDPAVKVIALRAPSSKVDQGNQSAATIIASEAAHLIMTSTTLRRRLDRLTSSTAPVSSMEGTTPGEHHRGECRAFY